MVRWPRTGALTPAQAVAEQRLLSGKVVERWSGPVPQRVAGVDVGVSGGRARAAVVVLSWPALEVLDQACAEAETRFPYVPGLLAYREVPCLLEAFAKLRVQPQLLFVDGHGRAHPRRLGVASHLALCLDLPAIGCGKSRLVGEHRQPGLRRGSSTRLLHRGEVIGRALRTRSGAAPVYVSVGHLIDLATAERLVLRACRGFRLPEPIRAAHALAARGMGAPQAGRT